MFTEVTRYLRITANIVIITVLLGLFAGCTCSPKLPLTVLTSAEGSVTMAKSGSASFSSVSAGMNLEAGDVIQAGEESSATITFFEGSTIELEAGTQVEIASLGMTQSGTTRILLKQQIGETISNVVKLVDSKSRYEIETVSATAAVRGSIMIVAVTSSGVTSVGNQEGTISIIAQGIEVPVPVGSHSVAVPGQPPAEPQPGLRAQTISSKVYTDNTGDMFNANGEPATGEKYLDIVNSYVLLTGGLYTIHIELDEHCPEATAEPSTFIEWDVLFDTDKNPDTGTTWPLISNDTGYDYMARMNLEDKQYGGTLLETHTGVWSDIDYIVSLYNYKITGNIVELYVPAEAIGNPDSFYWIIAVRKYLADAPPNYPSVSDKLPDDGHFNFPE
jgi:hypothetical protein